MDYYFSVISGVLPSLAAPKRSYVPKGSHPHVAWVAESNGTSAPCCGTSRRLKGDGTTACMTTTTATATTGSDHGDSEANGKTPMREYGLRRLLTVDGATGTRMMCYSSFSSFSVNTQNAMTATQSTAIPSGRRIGVVLPPRVAHDMDEAPDFFYVSDDIGNVYRFTPQQLLSGGAGDELQDGEGSPKRVRHETATSSSSFSSLASTSQQWSLLAPAQSCLTTKTSAVGFGSSSTWPSLFSSSYGAPGWVGLAELPAISASSSQSLLACAREHYMDLRVVDMSESAAVVVRTYSTTHSPTSMHCPEALPHCVLLTEGCLATLFDVRCPSAVLTLSQVMQARADADASSSSAVDTTSTAATAASEAVEGEEGQTRQNYFPLVPGRLTSIVGNISSCCATANPMEVALSVDRSLSLYDYRKFNRLFTSSNVLKYSIASVTSFAGGRAVVCAGIDAEVRMVPLHPKSSGQDMPVAGIVLSIAEVGTKKSKQGQGDSAAASASSVAGLKTGDKKNTASMSDPRAPAENDPSQSTFRTRLNSSVCCETTWQGGWVTSVNAGGAVAVGLSMDSEIFTTQ